MIDATNGGISSHRANTRASHPTSDELVGMDLMCTNSVGNLAASRNIPVGPAPLGEPERRRRVALAQRTTPDECGWRQGPSHTDAPYLMLASHLARSAIGFLTTHASFNLAV
jgi:hypothetical protein